jgi:microcystin-dependent protein
MAGATFTIPLITVIPGQLIASALWNNEFTNIANNLNPLGLDGYEDTDTQMQIQTAPYPGSVTSHATSLGGEIERIRYQISQILGATTPAYWYAAPPTNLTALQNITVPLGAVIDYHSATPPNNNWLLANGQAIGRSAFAALNTLYSAASYPFGNGDGSTTFNLPNYTDRMSIAAGNLYAVAATGGEATHTLVKAEIPTGLHTLTDPNHSHTITDPNHSHGVTDPQHSHTDGMFSGGTGGAKPVQGGTTPSGTLTTSSSSTGVTVNSSSTGITGANSGSSGVSLNDLAGGGSHNNLPPYLGMYRLIRVL